MKRLLTTLVALVALIGTAWCAPVTKGAKVDLTSLLLRNNAGITHQSDAGKPASRKNAPAVSPQSDPYISPVYSKVMALPGDLIRVNVKTNVGDDVHSGMDSGLVKIDNPEIASLYGIYKWDDETYIYYFYAGSVVGETTIHISSPILNNAGLETTVSMEVSESVSPEDVAISFAPDTPETVVCGTPVDITVTYPEGWLDGYGVNMWEYDDYDLVGLQTLAGRSVITLIPKKDGELSLTIGSGIHDRFDYSPARHIFNRAAPYITVDKSEQKVMSEREFSVTVKTNVGDDLYDGERNGMIRIDNQEVASFDRIERQDDETFRYVFHSGNIDGETKIHISSPILEAAGLEAAFIVTVTTNVNPEDIQLSFAPDTPETVVCGTPVDITVTYPEGFLDDFDLWIDSGGFDVFEEQRNLGMRTYRMVAQNLGQVSLSVGSELHERLGLPRLERTFECVSPDYAQTAGEKIILNVLTNSGESNMSLSKKSEGVYGATVNLVGETAFRISVPTATGNIVLGGYRDWDAFGFNDGWVTVFTGSDRPWGTQYTLQDVTGMYEYGLGSHYLGTRNNGEYELTVDLNTMTATLKSADFNPYITVEQPEIKVLSERELSVTVKTNVGDDLYEGERNGMINIDNPEVASFDRIERQDDETFRYVFRSGNIDGETKIHISSPILEAAGLEGTFIVTVTTTVNPEDIAISFAPDTPETLVFGELTDITVTYPEGVLDEDENYVWQASDGGYIREIRNSRLPGKTVFTVRAEALGEWGMQVGSNLGDQLGMGTIECRFNVVAPDYAQNGGEEITLRGRNFSGDYSATLTRKEPGVYTGTMDLDGQTIFRVYVPTSNGDVALAPNMGGGDSWEFESQSDSESFSVRVGDESSRGQTFELQNVTEDISNEDDYWTIHDFFLGSRYVGQSELTVDLNTMTARLSRPDFKPYITVAKSELKVLSESEFSIIVKSNVGDDLYDGERNGMIRIDNPELASFDRIERQDDETFRYVFRSGNIDGETKIHITSPMLEEAGIEAVFTVTVTTTVNPEDIQLSFAPDTPETVVCGTPVDITVTYPEGWLDNFDLWLDGGFDELEQQRNPGMRTYRMIAQNLGQVSLSVGSELHERLGLPRLERTFECVSPDYAQTAGEKIILNVLTNSGESVMYLTKKSEGVYGTTVNLSGETAFRISVPTANGDVVLGGYRSWDGFDFNGWFIDFFGGNVHSWGTQYTLQEVTDVITYDPNGRYLGTRHKGEYELTVDLNTMTASLKSADFKPYITVDQSEMKVRRNSEFIIRVKTNVNDDVYEGEYNGFITIDNPGLAWFNWLERIDDETFDYHFNSNGESGSTTIHISSPILREAGLEAVVNVTVGDFRTESVTLSSSEVTVGMGKYAVVSYSAEPFDEVWLNIENGNEDVCALVVDNDRRVFVLGKGVGESEIIFRPNDNPDVTAVLKVTVLPADAKVAEHIVYTELEPEQRTRLYLDEHQDGSEAAPAWSSSDESVAVVDADGRVTALKAGRAVITADCGAHHVMAGIHVKNSTDVDEVAESRVNVYSQGTAVTVVGTEEGDTVSVYAADGSLMTSRRSDGSALRFDLGVRGAFVVTAGSESFKVVL